MTEITFYVEPSAPASTGYIAYPGKGGSRWYNGAGVPSNSLGAVYDYYLNNTTGDYYEKTANTTWTLRGQLAASSGAVADATPTVKGIAKLYANLSASNTDGAPDQASVKAAVDTLQTNITNETTARTTADGLKEDKANKNAANGYAGLDGSGKIDSAQLPLMAITNSYPVASQAAMLALTAQVGDVAVRSDISTSFILAGSDPTILGNWLQLLSPGTSILTSGHIFVGNGSNSATDVAMSGDITINNSGVTSIGAQKIVNSMVSSSAAIAITKLAGIADGSFFMGTGSGNGGVFISGDATVALGGALTIANNVITNAKVSASAAIAFSKLAALSSGNILVGSSLNVATSVTLSGDATMSNAGAITIANNAITNVKILNSTIDLTAKVTGRLPYANQPQGSALSVLGVSGNSAADIASLVAGTDHQVLRRSGASVGFGALNLASTNAVTGLLPITNLGIGSDGQILRMSGSTVTWVTFTGPVRVSDITFDPLFFKQSDTINSVVVQAFRIIKNQVALVGERPCDGDSYVNLLT